MGIKQWTVGKSAPEQTENVYTQRKGAHFRARIQGLGLVLGHGHRARILAWALELENSNRTPYYRIVLQNARDQNR